MLHPYTRFDFFFLQQTSYKDLHGFRYKYISNKNEILTAIPFEKYRFAVITYEHDHSVDITSSYRDKSRRFLKSYGYELVVKDVSFDDEYTFEDWWIHPDLVNPDIVNQMKSVDTDVTNVVKYFFT